MWSRFTRRFTNVPQIKISEENHQTNNPINHTRKTTNNTVRKYKAAQNTKTYLKHQKRFTLLSGIGLTIIAPPLGIAMTGISLMLIEFSKITLNNVLLKLLIKEVIDVIIFVCEHYPIFENYKQSNETKHHSNEIESIRLHIVNLFNLLTRLRHKLFLRTWTPKEEMTNIISQLTLLNTHLIINLKTSKSFQTNENRQFKKTLFSELSELSTDQKLNRLIDIMNRLNGNDLQHAADVIKHNNAVLDKNPDAQSNQVVAHTNSEAVENLPTKVEAAVEKLHHALTQEEVTNAQSFSAENAGSHAESNAASNATSHESSNPLLTHNPHLNHLNNVKTLTPSRPQPRRARRSGVNIIEKKPQNHTQNHQIHQNPNPRAPPRPIRQFEPNKNGK